MANSRYELWGEGHSHSDWSDGFSTLAENTHYYALYDHDFHFACDHLSVDVSESGATPYNRDLFRMSADEISTYRREALASGTPEHPVIDGIELTWRGAEPEHFGATNRHHVLLRDQLDQVPDASFFHGIEFGNALSALKELGLKPFLAHVDDAIPPAHLTGAEISGIEIRFDIERRENPLELTAVPIWDRWLTAGHRVALTGGSDAHQMDLWAASGFRNVVRADSTDPESIRSAMLAGHAYLSSTWYPDLYERFGCTPNVPGAGFFTPWWRLKTLPQRPTRDEVRDELQQLIDATISEPGIRTHRRFHPTMRVSVDGISFGEVTTASDQTTVALRVDMNVPLEEIRIWADGVVERTIAGDGITTRFDGTLTLDLEGRHYVRIDASGRDDQDHAEFLMSNPVYFSRAELPA